MEAFAAAFYIVGLKELGERLLGKFKWGHSFYEVNFDLLEMYAKCKDGADVVAQQNEFLSSEAKANENKPTDEFFNFHGSTYNPNRDMPPSSSDDEADYENEEEEQPPKGVNTADPNAILSENVNLLDLNK